jgi:uncharacterized membrane protein YhaH (DUF805 family)
VAEQKRFKKFTLCRTSFWLFFLAGLSAATLAPLFNDPVITIAGIVTAVLVMAMSAAARLRDMGCSAWYTPLAMIPLVAVYTGITAGDHYQQNPTFIEYRVLATSFVSVAVSLSWFASLVVR